jgi:hypothetical protein
MCRVVSDPYDVLGCWCNNEFFLSGTMSIEGLNLLVKPKLGRFCNLLKLFSLAERPGLGQSALELRTTPQLHF